MSFVLATPATRARRSVPPTRLTSQGFEAVTTSQQGLGSSGASKLQDLSSLSVDSLQQVHHSVPEVMASKLRSPMPYRPSKVTTRTNWGSSPAVRHGNGPAAVVESIKGSDRMAAPLLPTDTRQCMMDELARVATANHRPWFRCMQGDDSMSTACVICRPNRLASCARCGSGCCSHERRPCAVVAQLDHCITWRPCAVLARSASLGSGGRCRGILGRRGSSSSLCHNRQNKHAHHTQAQHTFSVQRRVASAKRRCTENVC